MGDTIVGGGELKKMKMWRMFVSHILSLVETKHPVFIFALEKCNWFTCVSDLYIQESPLFYRSKCH